MADEKQALNGNTIQMEDYGSNNNSEDKIPIVGNDQLANNEDELPAQPYDIKSNKGLYFKDGKRKIDYMLAYEEQIEVKQPPTESPKETDPLEIGKKEIKSDKKKERMAKAVRQRTKFLRNLQINGVEIEEEAYHREKKIIHFTKLHIPFDTLCIFAEDLLLRAPLQIKEPDTMNWSDRALSFFRIPNIMRLEAPRRPVAYETCQFKRSKMHNFINLEDEENFFNTRQRQLVAYEILCKTLYGKRKLGEVGIDRLLNEEIFTAAFPLHEGDWQIPEKGFNPDSLGPRQVLYQYWARWGCWYKYQPIEHIRDYFGEKIGLYFVWLGFYTAWLLPCSVVGLGIFLYGVVTTFTYIPNEEVCNSGGEYLMCPLCDAQLGCDYYNLSDTCLYTRISYLFDQPGTVLFAVFATFWAVSFLEFWKRKNAHVAYDWDVTNFEEEEERPRPQYAAKCTTTEPNPITGIMEPSFPQRQRFPRIVSGLMVIIIMVVVVVVFIVAVILYRLLIAMPIAQNSSGIIQQNATLIATCTACVLQLIIIMILAKVYTLIAIKINEWEMHRTETEFEDSLIFKVFIFQFFNFYSAIIYIAFFKGKFTGYPGNYVYFFGIRMEDCFEGLCMIELAEQLGIIMIGKQLLSAFMEIFLPKLKAKFQEWKLGKLEEEQDDQWEKDYALPENEGLFEEYLEMVLQYGFITIFVAAFPIAPLLALINNYTEIRVDAQKFICETRRPIPARGQDIGVWFIILDTLTMLAVVSNAFLIAFTSSFIPTQLYQFTINSDLVGYVNFSLAWAPNGTTSLPCRYTDYRDVNGVPTTFYWNLLVVRLTFVIIFEHVVLLMSKAIDIMVPDVPESLEIKIKREQYLAKQALTDIEPKSDRQEEVA